MNEPWYGSQPPDTPVTVTLPYRTAKRVLTAIVRDAQRSTSRGDDPSGVNLLASASDVFGDAVDAPPHRRFRLPEKLYHAVIAGNASQFNLWKLHAYDALKPEVNEPIFVNSVEQALSACYSGYLTYGTAHLRKDFQELLAAVKSRTFR